MGKKTVQGLLQHCKNARGWLYVYGTKGKVTSQAEIKSLQNLYGKSKVWDSDFNKAGNICCDCSGLISSYTGITRNSTGFINSCSETASIAQLQSNWHKYVGWCIWMQGHIGVVSDTIGYYYAMDGSARNWAHRPLKDNKWVKVGKLVDIEYYSDQANTVVQNVVSSADTYTLDKASKFDRAYTGDYFVTSGLNLRTGAGTKKALLCTMPKGTRVHCYGYYSIAGTRKWLLVKVTVNNVTYTGFASTLHLSKI